MKRNLQLAGRRMNSWVNRKEKIRRAFQREQWSVECGPNPREKSKREQSRKSELGWRDGIFSTSWPGDVHFSSSRTSVNCIFTRISTHTWVTAQIKLKIKVSIVWEQTESTIVFDEVQLICPDTLEEGVRFNAFLRSAAFPLTISISPIAFSSVFFTLFPSISFLCYSSFWDGVISGLNSSHACNEGPPGPSEYFPGHHRQALRRHPWVPH